MCLVSTPLPFHTSCTCIVEVQCHVRLVAGVEEKNAAAACERKAGVATDAPRETCTPQVAAALGSPQLHGCGRRTDLRGGSKVLAGITGDHPGMAQSGREPVARQREIEGNAPKKPEG